MKFLETHFDEYISAVSNLNLHPKLEKIYERFPSQIESLGNIIFYGPSGVGKYSQMLYSIRHYSPTLLKYEKKLSITYDKKQLFLKISDIHFEVDMSLLGCISKLLWHDIYQHISDILLSKQEKYGIIVCKEFHNIHSELLENFYSYMQDNHAYAFNIKFILLTEQISFIPDPIINCCEVIHVSRPSKSRYSKCIKAKINQQMSLDSINNIKTLQLGITELMHPHQIICNKIVNEIVNIDNLNFLKFRDMLYDIFIYNLDISTCVWYMLTVLVKQGHINNSHMSKILIKTYAFFKYYNNNYRPIYHLENYLFYLSRLIHGM